MRWRAERGDVVGTPSPVLAPRWWCQTVVVVGVLVVVGVAVWVPGGGVGVPGLVVWRWQATQPPVGRGVWTGCCWAQMSMAWWQRVRNVQPDGWVQGVGDVALEDDAVAGSLDGGVGDGDGGEQRFGVGVGGVGVDGFGGAFFDDAAEVHDGGAVGEPADDGQVVGDEQVGDAEVLAELFEQFEDLVLGGDVEGGDGLVEDDQFRVEGDGAGDGDALALPAGELVGVALGVLG